MTYKLVRLAVIGLLTTSIAAIVFLSLSLLQPGVMARAASVKSLFVPMQEFREVGQVRIWADGFAEVSGTITATGNIQLGPAQMERRWFSISQNAVWVSGTQSVTLQGQLGIPGNSAPLLAGAFALNGASGALAIPLTSTQLYRKLGDSEIEITPTLSVNVLQPEVNASAQISMALPEGPFRPLVQFKLGANDKITGTVTVPISLSLAGGSLTATVGVDQNGLFAPSAVYRIQNITATLADLRIDGKGDTKIHFGSGVDFPLPDIDLGDGFFVLNQLRGQLGVSVGVGNPPVGYVMGLTGTLTMNELPENSSVTVNTANLRFANGGLSGGVQDFKIVYSGNNLKLKGVQFGSTNAQVADIDGAQASDAVRQRLIANDIAYELPKEWRPIDEVTPTISLHNVIMQSAPPYIVVGGVGLGFTSSKVFYLGGDASAPNAIKLSGIQGKVDFDVQGNRWSTTLTGTLGLKLGGDVETEVTAALRTNSAGKFSCRVVSVGLTVSGIAMRVNQLDFQDNAFTATSATLTLPDTMGNVVVNDIRIDQRGLKIGSGTFGLPNISLAPIQLTENTGAFSFANNRWSIDITSTIKVEGGASPLPGSAGTGVLVRGKAHIRNGRVSGEFDQFGFILSGLEFRLTNPRFVDDHLVATQASIKLPQGPEFSASGIEIGGRSGFKFQRPTIQIPEFTLAGVGIKQPQIKIERIAGSNPSRYRVQGSATLQFVQFSVAGNFTMIQNSQNGVDFQPVHLEFQASPGIPLGESGFELTRITADFNLTSNSANISMGVRIESNVKVIIPIVAMDGTITLQVKPRFDLRARANAQVVGINVATTDLHITPSSARLTGELEYQVARLAVDFSFGVDSDNEFTLNGTLKGELGLKKGSLIHWCVFECVDVPPVNWTVAQVTYDAGKFKDRRDEDNIRTVWGGRSTFSVLGNRAYAFLRLAPAPVKIIVGTDLDDYRAVNPVLARPQAINAPDYIAANGMHSFQITRSAELLVFAEVVTTTNLNQTSPYVVVTSPAGKQFTLPPMYIAPDRTSRLYSLTFDPPAQAIGVWQVQSAPGNAMKMWGQRPAIQINTFEMRNSAGQLIPLTGTTNLVLPNDEKVRFNVAVTKPEATMPVSVQLFAEGTSGKRYAIAERNDETNGVIQMNGTWAAATLPSGMYTFTVVADNLGRSLAFSNTVMVEVQDNTPPNMPVNLVGNAQADGSILLQWTADHAPDLAGYTITVDDQDPISIDGPRSNYSVMGLLPGQSHTLRVQAYDSSNNTGLAASVSVTLSPFRIESLVPSANGKVAGVNDVAIAFNSVATVTALALVDEHNLPVVGNVAPMTVQLDVDVNESIGGHIALPQRLSAGVYTATASAIQADGTPVTWQWSFTALEGGVSGQLFMPLLSR